MSEENNYVTESSRRNFITTDISGENICFATYSQFNNEMYLLDIVGNSIVGYRPGPGMGNCDTQEILNKQI